MKNIFFIPALLLVFSLSSYTSETHTYLRTSLRVTVLDGMGNLVEGAKVTIYANEEDFKKSENPVQDSQLTNEKGVVTFKDIAAQTYFVDVTKDKMSNYGAAQQTPVLQSGKMNKVNIVID